MYYTISMTIQPMISNIIILFYCDLNDFNPNYFAALMMESALDGQGLTLHIPTVVACETFSWQVVTLWHSITPIGLLNKKISLKLYAIEHLELQRVFMQVVWCNSRRQPSQFYFFLLISNFVVLFVDDKCCSSICSLAY